MRQARTCGQLSVNMREAYLPPAIRRRDVTSPAKGDIDD